VPHRERRKLLAPGDEEYIGSDDERAARMSAIFAKAVSKSRSFLAGRVCGSSPMLWAAISRSLDIVSTLGLAGLISRTILRAEGFLASRPRQARPRPRRLRLPAPLQRASR
jgi:hypothetical protein